MKRKNIMLAIIVLTSLSLQAQDKKITKSFSGIKEIKLSASNGDCQIVKNSTENIDVELVYTYSDDIFNSVFEQDGDVLLLKEKFKKNTSSRGHSDWKLSVPENIKVSINSGSGDIRVKSLAIELKSNSGSGDVTLDYVRGDIMINSGSGETVADTFDGSLKVNTGSGDINLTDAKGEFSINLGSGNIEANQLTGKFKVNVGSGDIDIKDVSLTAKSDFNAGSGDINIGLKSQLKNDISITSGSGNAVLDFNGLAIAGKFTMKANKKHGVISAPFDFDEVTEEGRGNQTVVKKFAKIGNSNVNIKITTGSGRAEVEK